MTLTWAGDANSALPHDAARATLIGRVWNPSSDGPSVVAVRDGRVVDLSAHFPTSSALTEYADPVAAVGLLTGPDLGSVGSLLFNTPPEMRDSSIPWLLSPVDLHVIKAAGVTFPASMLERLIEERAQGDAEAAHGIRSSIRGTLGSDLADLVPGTPEAARLKRYLIAEGLWSQYLEVGIGPDAEIFTKAPVLATVGTVADVGIRRDSRWNNPEPEVVLVVASTGRIVGAALGNDVNLRDFEGRSALLLGHAKDNNGSASVGPFIRLFDESFSMNDVRTETIALTVEGTDGFRMQSSSHMSHISRDPIDLVAQALGPHHQYPDGFVLYLGTMFAPTEDRDESGRGFTHHLDDVVRISSPRLGSLVNRVRYCEDLPPWDFGISALFTNLVDRGLI